MSLHVKKTVLGWMLEDEARRFWFRPNQWGRLHIFANTSGVNPPISAATARSACEAARAKLGATRFGGSHSDERRRLCEAVLQELQV